MPNFIHSSCNPLFITFTKTKEKTVTDNKSYLHAFQFEGFITKFYRILQFWLKVCIPNLIQLACHILELRLHVHRQKQNK